MTTIPNIGPRGISRRLKGGYQWLAITGVAGLVMVIVHAPWPVKLLVLLPAYRAGLGFFQAKEKT